MIHWAEPAIFGNEIDYIGRALKSTFISGGEFLDLAEKKLGAIHGGRCLCVANGTVSVYLALQTLGIGEGDEVLVPGWCFAAVANMAMALKATPVFVDITGDTWLMDPGKIEGRIGKRTRAILPVHTYGNVCDMPAIRKIADRHNLSVIEDCAESIFSTIDGKPCGAFSDIASFSFQATKTITCGEGGMVLVNRDDLIRKATLIRSHGMDRSDKYYWHHLLGFNFRLTNLQAAMLCAQLDHLDEIRERRKRLYGLYARNLSRIGNISLQAIPSNVDPVIWALGVRIDSRIFGPKARDGLIGRLKEDGIETRPGFYAFADQPLYQSVIRETPENAASVSREVISLPFHLGLKEEDVDLICGRFERALQGSPRR